ncbi:DNA recombination protein RmuC [Tepidimonas thermarum]|nr:DNA recombination protein RmuC [Tepidimonas thermarum]
MTPDTLLVAALGLGLLNAVLLLILLLRKPRLETPPDLDARLGLVEQQLHSLTQTSIRTDTGVERLDTQLRDFVHATHQVLGDMRQTLDDGLNKAMADARAGRVELSTAFGALQGRLEQRIGAFDASMTQRFDSLQQALLGRLAEATQAQTAQQASLSAALKGQLETLGQLLHGQFTALQASVAQQLRSMAEGTQHNAEQLRQALNERLAAIQADNTAKLEEMRRTVDEKLHATLEQRLGESFRLVSERLEQVHAGLGEMKTLAGSVGDLKRVMTNVRTRGTWGEVQLGAIIENLLTAEQYDRNVRTVEGSADLVEYAIKMPGRHDHDTVWLPIDSKYPVEDYQRLLDAHDSGDKELVQKATAAFASALKNEARKIREKYVSPPRTTDFAILFVPTEGLFAEVCRIPGMVETLQNDFRVVVAGPTTLAAMLNSLRLGFRTLAIEKRSSEVWQLLASVKTEFRKFGDTIEATRRSIDSAAKKFSDIGVRTRAIERRLRGVEALPDPSASPSGAADWLSVEDDAADEPPTP